MRLFLVRLFLVERLNNKTDVMENITGTILDNTEHLNRLESVMTQIYRMCILLVLVVMASAMVRIAITLRSGLIRERGERRRVAERSVDILLAMENKNKPRRATAYRDKQTETESLQSDRSDCRCKESYYGPAESQDDELAVTHL